MSDMSNMPISEQFRVAAKAWVDLDSAASLLEETKSAFRRSPCHPRNRIRPLQTGERSGRRSTGASSPLNVS